jgi:3-deoxy-D-manno-octulosonate 8-phosphate phosphatase KdsC-like HAD superfamily phosphatase
VKRISAKLRKKAQRIQLLLLDVDGALTDGGIVYVTEGMGGRGAVREVIELLLRVQGSGTS